MKKYKPECLERSRKVCMNTRKIGAFYEEAACEYLQKQGVLIMERNFRCRQGEVDIIGRDKNCVIFFEVKYRRSEEFGALYAVPYTKQKKICRCADYYMMTHPWIYQIRYDVIGITGTRIEWVKNAFNHIGYHWK